MVAQAILLGLMAGAASERYGLTLPGVTGVKGALVPTDDQTELAAWAAAQALVKSEEGVRTTVYKDSLGKLTVGVGHLVLPGDGLKLGDVVTIGQVNEWFGKDLLKAFNAAIGQARELDKYNIDMIARLTSVNFQLGTGWRYTFPNTWSLIKSGKINAAAKNLMVAKYEGGKPANWYAQTPNRVIAFVNELKSQYA